MQRALIISAALVLFGTRAAFAGSFDRDAKRIIGEWSDSRSGKTSLFHSNGTWGVKRADEIPEEIHGRWWIKHGKLCFTYTTDNGVGTPVHRRTARCLLTFINDDRFITETGGYKTIYDRYR